ncbi:hypothetical protein EYF80_010550 [Liparis tanakae]|uniref:Uncharacterized protein n=1 Tax=Liparis tanakae TaxID=230148 RepID=A0A4Z2IN60_9TELE|nr:hypothetical protein EYF80_010550 [Liparis tanakae]
MKWSWRDPISPLGALSRPVGRATRDGRVLVRTHFAFSLFGTGSETWVLLTPKASSFGLLNPGPTPAMCRSLINSFLPSFLPRFLSPPLEVTFATLVPGLLPANDNEYLEKVGGLRGESTLYPTQPHPTPPPCPSSLKALSHLSRWAGGRSLAALSQPSASAPLLVATDQGVLGKRERQREDKESAEFPATTAPLPPLLSLCFEHPPS